MWQGYCHPHVNGKLPLIMFGIYCPWVLFSPFMSVVCHPISSKTRLVCEEYNFIKSLLFIASLRYFLQKLNLEIKKACRSYWHFVKRYGYKSCSGGWDYLKYETLLPADWHLHYHLLLPGLAILLPVPLF